MHSESRITPDQNDTAAAIVAGRQSLAIEDRWGYIGEPQLPVAISESGNVTLMKEVLAEMDRREPHPPRIIGTAELAEVDSFIAFVNRFKQDHSAIFADVRGMQLTAVLNYHHAAIQEVTGEVGHDAVPPSAEWADHRAVYACPVSDRWKLWTGKHEQSFTQDQFGQFLDDNASDIVSPQGDERGAFPTAAALIEMARNLIVRVGSKYERQYNPTTGEATLVAKDEHETSSTKIPKAFLLGIPVFEAGKLYQVEARIRFAMVEGRPRFSFSLYRAEDVKRHAFGEIRAHVEKGTGLPLFAGSPER